ncbi:MAG: hypothetical protein WCJ41_11535 [Aestuariivirga sp.]|jgi:hypothetical protein|uniref:hypothetical protein n=1 Tax=Aestuariivirga sp. TaxID=2650926 RepID=UPI003018207D
MRGLAPRMLILEQPASSKTTTWATGRFWECESGMTSYCLTKITNVGGAMPEPRLAWRSGVTIIATTGVAVRLDEKNLEA